MRHVPYGRQLSVRHAVSMDGTWHWRSDVCHVTRCHVITSLDGVTTPSQPCSPHSWFVWEGEHHPCEVIFTPGIMSQMVLSSQLKFLCSGKMNWMLMCYQFQISFISVLHVIPCLHRQDSVTLQGILEGNYLIGPFLFGGKEYSIPLASFWRALR